eukprot:3360808-Pleurochrysis_carterae.AAC.2
MPREQGIRRHKLNTRRTAGPSPTYMPHHPQQRCNERTKSSHGREVGICAQRVRSVPKRTQVIVPETSKMALRRCERPVCRSA